MNLLKVWVMSAVSILVAIAHPGLYYAVLHSTVVVHGFFNRRNDGDGGSCDRS